MLVLTRRTGEEIVIGGNIRVTVVGVSGQRVRLGIAAPPSVAVVRLELLPKRSASAAAAAVADNSQNGGCPSSELGCGAIPG